MSGEWRKERGPPSPQRVRMLSVFRLLVPLTFEGCPGGLDDVARAADPEVRAPQALLDNVHLDMRRIIDSVWPIIGWHEAFDNMHNGEIVTSVARPV